MLYMAFLGQSSLSIIGVKFSSPSGLFFWVKFMGIFKKPDTSALREQTAMVKQQGELQVAAAKQQAESLAQERIRAEETRVANLQASEAAQAAMPTTQEEPLVYQSIPSEDDQDTLTKRRSAFSLRSNAGLGGFAI